MSLIFTGYFIGDEGEHCDKVCFDQNLTCRWLEISKPNNYSETINDLNATCQYNKTTVWEKDWHPAISSSDTCLGAVNVSSSRCKPDDNMDNSYSRLCRCIYPGMRRLISM